MENWNTLAGENINDFHENYRKALGEQRDTNTALLGQQRQNQQQAIMSGANVRGLLYSNFPARQKIQYDTQSYYPALAQVQTTYQTGLDKLRANTANYWNQIQELKKNIENLNSLYA